MRVQFALALVGTCDELLVGLFDSELAVREFCTANPPAPTDGKNAAKVGPLAAADMVRGCGPSLVLGYLVTECHDGKPVRSRNFYWTEDNWEGDESDADRLEAFDATVPLFPAHPQEEWAHDGERQGGGPVA